jgi:hypothetical protein
LAKSEDGLRTKVVYPWLVDCGFNPAENSIEFSRLLAHHHRAVAKKRSSPKTQRGVDRGSTRIDGSLAGASG